MRDSQADFNKRLSVLGRKHQAMSRGFTTVMRSDGLIVVRPNRALRRGFPIKGLLALVLGFFVFKAIMVSSLSEITYNERVAKLKQGGAFEQGGAWLMQIDPVTAYLAGFIEPFIE
ncbi:MAG: hypothetical protein AAFO97_04045 [Pseudomonadota bacterium]